MSRARDTAGIIQYNKISIDSNNAVGIGSSIPDCKLDINGGLRVVGFSTFEGSSTLISGDNKLNFNTNSGQEGQLYATSEYFYINSSASTGMYIQANGFLNIRSDSGEDMFKGIENGAVELYYDNSKKLETTGGGINITGITTADAFSGFDYLQAPHSESTINFAVTVAAKTTAHRYDGSGSSNGYVINGVESPFLTLTPGITYRFTLSSSDMSSHPFRFYLEADKTTQYTTNVTSTATYTEITVTDSTPTVLHYQCSSHGYMGNAVQVNSNVVNTNYAATLRDSLTVSGNINANGNIVGDNSTNISGINQVTATSFSGSAANLTDLPEGTNVLKAMLFV